MKSSSLSSSERDVVDCAGELCLYTGGLDEPDGFAGVLIVVGDNNGGSTWKRTREEIDLLMSSIVAKYSDCTKTECSVQLKPDSPSTLTSTS